MQASETVTWVSVTTEVDHYGDGTTTEAPPRSLSALVADRSSVEPLNPNQPATTTGKTLYLERVDIEPGASDWFTVRGKRYEVDGEPHRWGTSGVVVNVKRADVAP